MFLLKVHIKFQLINNQMNTYINKLKFYADCADGSRNKLFSWSINSVIDVESRIIYFLKKGYQIKAAYFCEYSSIDGHEISSKKINLENINIK